MGKKSGPDIEVGSDELAKQLGFTVSLTELQKLMEIHGPEGAAIIKERYSSAYELTKNLKSNADNGMNTNQVETNRRAFGANVIKAKPPKSFFMLAFEAAQDFTLIVLMLASLLSFLLTFYSNYSSGELDEEIVANYIESAAILVAVGIVILVTATTDWAKEKQFQGLKKKMEIDLKFQIIRDGQVMQIPVGDIVVGDICQIKYGDLLPADGVVVQSNDLKMDESALTGESDFIKKGENINPMLLSGTHVMEGSGKMLVTAVGINSQAGIIFSLLGAVNSEKSNQAENLNIDSSQKKNTNATTNVKKNRQVDKMAVLAEEDDNNVTAGKVNNLNNEEELVPLQNISNSTDNKVPVKKIRSKEKSVLQNKLTKLSIQIGYFGFAAAVLTVVVLIGRFLFEQFIIEDKPQSFRQIASSIITFLITGVTVLVVAVPEGLPLAVTLALAYSVRKMMDDNNMVRHLDACETMGNATAICSDKTGTLTTNRMTVVQAYVAGKLYRNDSSPGLPKYNDFKSCEEFIEHIVRGISINSGYTSLIVSNQLDGSLPKQVGNKTECALLGFVLAMGKSFEEERKIWPEQRLHKVYTFNSVRKSMSTVIHLDDEQAYVLYCKGASEIVAKKCRWILSGDGTIRPFTREDQANLTSSVIEPMASEGLRTICVAYKKMIKHMPGVNKQENEEIFSGEPNWDNEDAVINDLTCLAILGIEDPVRPEVPDAINNCQKAGITVRMVTGDNINTARSIAMKCGILSPNSDFLVLEGPDFNQRIRDRDTGLIKQDLIDKIWPKLRVLARSSPMDKYNLVSGIIASHALSKRQVVAVTGDGTNDGPALKKADVGFAMGIAGTDVAKEASDIILTDDNFTSIVKAVLWGRNVYDGISKFLQFQLTANIVAVIVAFSGAAILGATPLKAMQLLWVNLIMDTLGSLALSTDKPTLELLDRQPYGRTKALLSRLMIKNILGHAIYQTIIIFLILFLGPRFFDISDGSSITIATPHFTMIFNSFVLMTMFNELNARKIHGQRNIFKGLLDNKIFIAIHIFTAFFQFIIVQFGGHIFRTSSLSLDQWLWCLFFGIGSLVWHQIIITVPNSVVPNQCPAVCLPLSSCCRKRTTAQINEDGEEIPNTSTRSFASDNEGDEDGDEDNVKGQILWIRGLSRLQTQMQAIKVVNAFRMGLDAHYELDQQSMESVYGIASARFRKTSSIEFADADAQPHH